MSMNALMAFYDFNITLSKVRACKGIIVVLCDLYNKCSCMSLYVIVVSTSHCQLVLMLAVCVSL
jgi:hypothetical protein